MDVFLNNLLTCSLPEAGTARYGFLLNPQGRITAEMFVWCYDQEHFLLDCPESDVETLCTELLQRNFDPALKITLPDSLSIETSQNKPDDHEGWSILDPRIAEMGWRSILENTPPRIDQDYTKRRLRLGLPEGAADLPRGEALPLEYGLESAIDFTKGCFMGQEVCTRMHRMGKSKFSVRAFECKNDVPAGAVFSNNAHPKVGTVISSYGQKGFTRLHYQNTKKTHSFGILRTWSKFSSLLIRLSAI